MPGGVLLAAGINWLLIEISTKLLTILNPVDFGKSVFRCIDDVL